MFPIRIKACSESDLRMLGNLARNIQRVLPVTQADIDAAAALGKGWVVWKVIEVNDPIDNLRGGTQLVIKQNSITPGQNVRRVLIVSGPGGETVVIGPGPSPLLLPDAIANSLSYVKAFGGTKQGGVPSGYTLLNGVANGANTYIDTGITPNVDNVEIEIRVKPSTGSWYILQSRASTIWGISGSSSGSTILLGWAGTGNLLTSAITRDTTHIYYIKATMNNGTATLYVKDETANTEDTKTATYTPAVPSLPFWLYGNQNNDRVNSGNKVFMARIKVGGKVVMDYVPSLNPSNVVGFYDTATGVFKVSAAGTLVADQTLVPTPATPIDIWCNNGVLKLGYTSRNLNVGTLDNQGYTSTGGTSTSTTFCGTLWKIKVQEGEKYTVSFGNFPDGVSGVFINTWLTDGTWNLRQAISISGDYTYTIPAGVGEVNFTLYKTGGITIGSNSWLQVEKGETATPYVPAGYGLYVDGTTETINVHGTNIFNKNDTENIGNWYCSSSSKIASAGSNQTLVMRAKPGATYYFKHCSVTGGGRAFYTEVEDWAVGSDCSAMSGTTTIDKDEVKSMTVSENAKWVFFICGRSGQTATFEEQLADYMVSLTPLTSDTQYAPYYDGGTATAEMLLSVGDYTDEQEILSGAVTRKVGVKVLDGTESVGTSNTTFTIAISDRVSSKTPLVCSHFQYSTKTSSQTEDLTVISFSSTNIGFRYDACANATAFKTWLANQYAAGTPVIVVYQLATETTESVTGQTLQVTDGDNVLEITQAGMDGLELEAEYTKVA